MPRQVNGDHPVFRRERFGLLSPHRLVAAPTVDEHERRFAGAGIKIGEVDAVSRC